MKNVALTLGDSFILFLKHQDDAFRFSFIFTVEHDLARTFLERTIFLSFQKIGVHYDTDKM